MSETKSFADFGVDPAIREALSDAHITTPFPIQELTLPLALEGADMIGQARTGTGKTLAFGIPLLQAVDASRRDTQALVVVPTRELCLQVRDDLDRAGRRLGLRILAIYGGRAIDPQSEALTAGVHVVVGTPGRLLDLMGRGVLDLSGVTTLVLDEADEMLDLGFLPDVERLVEATATERQTMLFSATMPPAIVSLARRYMRKPTFMRAEVEESRIAPETRQYFFSCHRLDKPAVLARILQTPDRGLCLVFTRTKRMADVLAKELTDRGLAAAAIHSDLRQEARERVMGRFRAGSIDVLAATEVAARGLDIDDVSHVVNYDCPDDEKMYLHRIGRTGRAGGAGVAITLAIWNELARLEMIKRSLAIEAQTHEVFSTSPILDELFDLPGRPPVTRPATDRGLAPRPTEAGPTGGRASDDGGGGGAGRRSRRRRRGADRGRPEDVRAEDVRAEDARVEDVRAEDARVEDVRAEDARAESAKAAGVRTAPQPDAAADRRTATEADGPQAASGPPATSDAAAGGSRRGGRGRSTRRRRRSQEGGRRGGSGPRGGRSGEPTGRRPAARADQVDAGTARGAGRPALSRPLIIAHLP